MENGNGRMQKRIIFAKASVYLGNNKKSEKEITTEKSIIAIRKIQQNREQKVHTVCACAY